MAITTDDTTWEGMDSNGVMTATRHITIPAGDMKQLDLAESNDIPQIGDAHPQNPQWTVYSIGNIQHADIPKEYRIPIKYRRVSGSGGSAVRYGSGGNLNDRAPWDNGVFNHRKTFGSIEKPLTYIYDVEAQKNKSLKNSSGQPIPASHTVYYRIDSFQCNFDTSKGKHKELAPVGLLNCNAENLFGEKILPYAGKIMRMDSEDHVVYQNDGITVKWQYETITYEIHWFEYASGWELSFLNVGNMAFFLKGEGEGMILERGRIYQYTPWESADPAVNAKVKPEFGCIDDVIYARNIYQEALKKAGKDYAQDIPWEEASDIPLDEHGMVDEAAIKTQDYGRINGYESRGESWSKYLPDEVMG